MKRKQKTTVAVLGRIVGRSQAQLAELAGCSRPMIQAIELGQRNLSPGIAQRLAKATGASLRWLLDGKPRKPIDSHGRPYTRETFDNHRAGQERTTLEGMPDGIVELASALTFAADILDVADERGCAVVAGWRIREALRPIAKDLGLRGHRSALTYGRTDGRVRWQATPTLDKIQTAMFGRWEKLRADAQLKAEAKIMARKRDTERATAAALALMKPKRRA